MIISHQQILKTLDILSARHQNIIDEFQKKGPSENLSPHEVIQIMNSSNALSVYNSLKQKKSTNICLNKKEKEN